jgi:hypothetical protein
MEKSAEEVFCELKEDISTYAELKLELLKLNVYEKGGRVLAVLSYGLLLFALVTTAVLFTLLSLGFLISEWLHSMAAGFGIVAVLYIIQILVLILNRNRIRRKIINIIIAALYTNEQKKNPETESKEPESN